MLSTAAGVAIFAAIHLFVGRLGFLDVVPRSRWLSLAGGMAVAYVFVHLLPELARRHHDLQGHLTRLDQSTYVVALTGLALFYGLERAVKSAKADENAPRATGVFWVHIGSFGLYNLLTGYLWLHRQEPGVTNYLFFVLAIGLHFLSSDYGLRQDHREAYDRVARWLLSAAVLAGWIVGTVVEVHGLAVDLLFAFLAGATILNVLKEELPEDRQSRFGPFAAGAVLFTSLLLLSA